MELPFRACRFRAHAGFALLAGLLGCSDSTAPNHPTQLGGEIDPGRSTVVLQRLSVPVSGRDPVPVDLVGSNLRIDSRAEQVTLDVALRNADNTIGLAPPAWVWIGCFAPAGVRIVNPDGARRVMGCTSWGFDYGATLGDDGVLAPGEISQPKAWVFQDPGLVSFAFQAEAQFGVADEPRISGTLYQDDNRNGVRDPYELPFEWGAVLVRGPNGFSAYELAPRGTFTVGVADPGLYTVSFARTYFCNTHPHDCICVTTTDRLEIVLIPGPDGRPQSYVGADFGVMHGPCDNPTPYVALVEVQRGQIPQDSYTLLGAALDGDVLQLTVGFSGCTAEHPFTLYASRRFAESYPVQTWAILAHDDLGEDCRAYFERTLRFDLTPLRWEYERQYRVPDRIRLHVFDFQGNEQEFLFGP